MMTALGEIDFISAQIIPARHIIPDSFQRREKAESSRMANAVRIVPENGTCKLWRKLPATISTEAHKLPITAAFSHIEFRRVCRINSILSNCCSDSA
jgi:hypothetical protein